MSKTVLELKALVLDKIPASILRGSLNPITIVGAITDLMPYMQEHGPRLKEKLESAETICKGYQKLH